MHFIDADSGEQYPISEPRWCGRTGSHLNLGPAPGLRRADLNRSSRSVWRYAKALLVDPDTAVTLGEGGTPLIPGSWDGTPVHYKLDFMMPTGSFKDRGMTVMVSYLKSRGVERVLEDSSGNAGASLAAYAAAAGMTCRILVPESASYPKIAQIAAAGADVVTICGSRQDVAEAALEMSREIFYASHNWQPMFVEGVKTLAYELWEQLGYQAPDNVVVPAGYGANVLGCARGFEELARNGEIQRGPRLFAVQAENCAPLAAAFRGVTCGDVHPTIAEGIASSKPTRATEVVSAVRDSGGTIVAVSEAEIVMALGALARRGLYVEPTSAAAAAGLTRLVEGGAIKAGETTVLVLTGSGLKSSERIGQLLGVGARLL